jgi:4-alpha-glucanotransferase
LLEKAKWEQFLFTRQWRQLKDYCNRLDIEIIGDLPFYISHDSVDVWADPELFSLDKNGGLEMIAGVPPDYFNANGQLWGMPVFKWDKLKTQNYRWWVQRIRMNMELFDLLRLDRFRAFSSYWAVRAGRDTAIAASWVKGPGADFFDVLKKESGKLPFIAEYLGDIDEDVYRLRDQFRFPGKKVLQFAFGNDMPVSPHIPHNYSPEHVAYTGTHDNNTGKGWYKIEAGTVQRENLNAYSGQRVDTRNVSAVLVNMIAASAAKTVIFPLQDLLDLDESARMNTPGQAAGNWQWRVTKKQLTKFPAQKLLELTSKYNRL